MRPKRFDYDPANADNDGVCVAQAVGSAKALTLNGAFANAAGTLVTMDYAHRLDQITAGDASLINFTYVGTDADGFALTEVLAGGAGTPSTETTIGYFKTITSITSSAAVTGNVTIGTDATGEIMGKIIPIDYASDSACAISVIKTGTINYTVEESFDLMNNNTIAPQDTAWTAITAFSGKTADVKGTASLGATAIRYKTTSFTSGAEAQVYVSQPVRG